MHGITIADSENMKCYRTIYGLDRDLASYLYGLENLMSITATLVGFMEEERSFGVPGYRKIHLQRHIRDLSLKIRNLGIALKELRKAGGFSTPIAPRPLDIEPFMYKGSARYPIGSMKYRKKRR